MIRTCSPLSFILVYLTLLSAAVYARHQETGFLNRTVKLGSTLYRFQVYVPSNWNKKGKWPVILFLHGAGERGEDGLIQTEVGIGTAVRRYVNRFPCSEFEGVQHNSWDKAYADAEFLPWLLSQALK